MSTNHTPLPWRTGNFEDYNPRVIFHSPDDTEKPYVPVGQCESEEDAAMIVRAVNCHQELMEALQAVINVADDPIRGVIVRLPFGVEMQVSAALAKATAQETP